MNLSLNSSYGKGALFLIWNFTSVLYIFEDIFLFNVFRFFITNEIFN